MSMAFILDIDELVYEVLALDATKSIMSHFGDGMPALAPPWDVLTSCALAGGRRLREVSESYTKYLLNQRQSTGSAVHCTLSTHTHTHTL